jgi:ribosomal protein S18 acetylase RimI-like enzyme
MPMSSDVEIDRLTVSDAKRASSLFAAILDDEWLPDGPPSIAHIERALADLGMVMCVARVNEHGESRDVGFAIAFRLVSPLKQHDEAYLDDLYVDAEYRQQGVGQALVAAVMAAMAAQNVPVLWTATDGDNEPMAAVMATVDGSERTDDVVHFAVGLPVPKNVPKTKTVTRAKGQR